MLPDRLCLCYEDRDVLVVDKPAGLLSIATDIERERTAYWVLAEYLRKKGEKRHPAVVHRLDRGTSGLLLFAKSEQVKVALMKRWNETVRERKYLALVEGFFAAAGGKGEERGTINTPLAEDGRGTVFASPTGKRCVTHWRLIAQTDRWTLLELELETGRRNQIRAHLSHAGHPVAGDAAYGAKSDPLKRLALHAEVLSFIHPRTGTALRFESPAPFRNFL
jgi:23S rRNA pseudouridine1911/1915/1917 synthase